MNKQPYFYVIQHLHSLKYYAGYKSYGSCSEDLMTPKGYKTSSKLVKLMIQEEGLDSFIVRKIKHFDTAEEAHRYEFRFLSKVNAKENPNFLNLSNGENDSRFCMTEKFKEYMSRIKTGTKWSDESKEKVSKTRTGKALSEWHRSAISSGKKGVKFSEEHRLNISKAAQNRKSRGKHKPETIEKIKTAHHERKKLGKTRRARSKESYLKQAETLKGKVWWTNGIICVKSVDSPGNEWHRGRKVNTT